jgi:hypothetical protein
MLNKWNSFNFFVIKDSEILELEETLEFIDIKKENAKHSFKI